MRVIVAPVAALILILAALPAPYARGEQGLRSVGVRGGFASSGRGNDLVVAEGDAVYRLPWEWRGGSGWGASAQGEGSLGLATAYGEYGLIASLGPSAAIGKKGFPLELLLGVSLGLLSRDSFGLKDYNGHAQFVSHAGLNYRFSPRLGFGYRFEHLSNAGINGRHNPGVNLHLFGLDWYLAP